jgi:hypothetical protein
MCLLAKSWWRMAGCLAYCLFNHSVVKSAFPKDPTLIKFRSVSIRFRAVFSSVFFSPLLHLAEVKLGEIFGKEIFSTHRKKGNFNKTITINGAEIRITQVAESPTSPKDHLKIEVVNAATVPKPKAVTIQWMLHGCEKPCDFEVVNVDLPGLVQIPQSSKSTYIRFSKCPLTSQSQKCAVLDFRLVITGLMDNNGQIVGGERVFRWYTKPPSKMSELNRAEGPPVPVISNWNQMLPQSEISAYQLDIDPKNADADFARALQNLLDESDSQHSKDFIDNRTTFIEFNLCCEHLDLLPVGTTTQIDIKLKHYDSKDPTLHYPPRRVITLRRFMSFSKLIIPIELGVGYWSICESSITFVSSPNYFFLPTTNLLFTR